ncbi:hypothetical protein R1sor_000369 [Riccia sorocarpa]|uniref:Heat shock protein 70 n=1 Tax=Riccia sorocarpa TaxID=122646 RepID=A0ABD3GVA5_9MARC
MAAKMARADRFVAAADCCVTPAKGILHEPAPKVGLDFGTTYSGFAYALASDTTSVHEFYDWPGQAAMGGKPYCKIETSLKSIKGLKHWGLNDTIDVGEEVN